MKFSKTKTLLNELLARDKRHDIGVAITSTDIRNVANELKLASKEISILRGVVILFVIGLIVSIFYN